MIPSKWWWEGLQDKWTDNHEEMDHTGAYLSDGTWLHYGHNERGSWVEKGASWPPQREQPSQLPYCSYHNNKVTNKLLWDLRTSNKTRSKPQQSCYVLILAVKKSAKSERRQMSLASMSESHVLTNETPWHGRKGVGREFCSVCAHVCVHIWKSVWVCDAPSQ